MTTTIKSQLPKELFVITYRRRGWLRPRKRLYLAEYPARQFIARLQNRGPGWEHLAPLVELRLTSRTLGEVEVHEEMMTPTPWL
jgi:hypothetical protein